MTRGELEEKYGDILNDWSEELRIEQDEKMIYYTKEQRQKNMQANKSSGTKSELLLAKNLTIFEQRNRVDFLNCSLIEHTIQINEKYFI